jgi:RIO kinase 1
MRQLAGPIHDAWVNQRLDSSVRATVISMSGQADALGQIAGGPAVGAIGSAISIRAAITTSGLILLPVLWLYARTSRRQEEPRSVAGAEGALEDGALMRGDSMSDWETVEDEYDTPGPKKTKRKAKPNRAHSVAALTERADSKRDFAPTFSSSKYEREWILNYLGPFYEEHIITDVLRQVKGGKEATVYCCRAHPSTGVKLIAAKVYRPRIFRTLKNDALYRRGREFVDTEGKQVRGRREKLAMKKKSDFGREQLHTTWLTNEYQHLRTLYAAGADVPKPFSQSDNAILIEYLGDANFPAPQLNTMTLEPREAREVFERLMWNIETFLAHGCIHADLSAFNVLYWRGAIKIIDLPQAVHPEINPMARALLTRDITRLCQYFARYGIAAQAQEIVDRLWAKFRLSVAG